MNLPFKVFAILLVASLAVADFRNTLRLCKVECDFSMEVLYDNFSCKVKAISRLRTALYFDFWLRRPTDPVVFVNLQVHKKNSVRYIPYMVNISVNACDLVAGKMHAQNWVSKFILEWLSPYSNFNHSCPYSGHIFVKRMEAFADNIPGFISAGDYRMDLHFFEKNYKNWFGTVRGYGTMGVKPFITQDVQ